MKRRLHQTSGKMNEPRVVPSKCHTKDVFVQPGPVTTNQSEKACSDNGTAYLMSPASDAHEEFQVHTPSTTQDSPLSRTFLLSAFEAVLRGDFYDFRSTFEAL